MTDVAAKKKKVAARPKTATHPTTAVMVTEALKTLKDRKGSSLQAIKKFISTTYMVDITRMAPFIRKYLISATDEGKITLTQGTGANGRFKLPAEERAKAVQAAKPKKTAAKMNKVRPPTAKAPAAKEEKVPSTAASKAKKAVKPTTIKPKSPKPKEPAPKKK